jgi:hypothetical protein
MCSQDKVTHNTSYNGNQHQDDLEKGFEETVTKRVTELQMNKNDQI